MQLSLVCCHLAAALPLNRVATLRTGRSSRNSRISTLNSRSQFLLLLPHSRPCCRGAKELIMETISFTSEANLTPHTSLCPCYGPLKELHHAKDQQNHHVVHPLCAKVTMHIISMALSCRSGWLVQSNFSHPPCQHVNLLDCADTFSPSSPFQVSRPMLTLKNNLLGA